MGETCFDKKNTSKKGMWCMIDDFNAVSHVDEMRGVNVNASSNMVTEINYFNSFVLNLDLLDVAPFGRIFTWYHVSGIVMSQIDRALVFEGWNNCWGEVSLWILPRTISDHCPLILKSRNRDWGTTI